MQVVSKFTYTLETIIQAGKMLVAVDHVPIRTNPKTRESRLFPSMWAYVRRNARLDLPHLRAVRAAARVHERCALVVGARRARRLGALPRTSTSRATASGHVQSLILGAVLFNAAVVLAALGVIGDLLAAPADHDSSAPSSACAGSSSQLGVAAVALRAGRRATTGREPTTGAHAGRRGQTEEREAVQAVSARHASTPRARSPATPTTSTARPTRSCGG